MSTREAITAKDVEHQSKLGMALVAVVLAMVCVLWPRAALARDYTMGPVSIDATLAADGSLQVVEERTFDFDGTFNGVYWKIPEGSYQGRDVTVDVDSAGVVEGEGELPLVQSQSGDDDTYEVSDLGSYVRLKLYHHADDERVTFRIAYTINDIATAWQDTGELYWKFVSDGWDETTHDITCTIHLPVPAGETPEVGQDVRAWGHGTLDGTVEVEGDEVVCSVPAVGTDDYAEVRVLFPVTWLTQLPNGRAHLDEALAEEQAWADEANAQRSAMRAVIGGSAAVIVGASVLTVVVALRTRARYRRTHTPTFQDAYFRDVPSKDHPAVLGCLWKDGEVEDACFTATLMGLTDQGAIELSLAQGDERGRGREDYVMRRNPTREAKLTDPIDDDMMHLLFGVIAPRARGYRRDPERRTRLYASQMRKVATAHPERFVHGVDDWKGTVSAKAESRGFFTDDRKVGKGPLIALLVLLVLLEFLGLVSLLVWEAPLPWFLMLLVPVVGAAFAIWAMATTRSYSAEAIELRAKLEALRRWLKEFTNLDEAPPTDVVLWNHLLVMAVVLGVADEVIAQLKVVMPQLLEDPGFRTTYVWHVGHGHLHSPASVLADAYHTSYVASAAKIAESSSSSGGGGGGGFSGGGGGGFGGGGGGGAF